METGTLMLVVGIALFAIVVVMLIYRRGRLDPRTRDIHSAEPNLEGDARSAARNASPPATPPGEVPSDRVGSGRT